MGVSSSRSVWDEIPPKTSYAHLKQHALDDCPVYQESAFPFGDVLRLDMQTLINMSNTSDEVQKIVASLKSPGFIILKASPEFMSATKEVTKVTSKFFDQTVEEKKKQATPHMVEGKRAAYSGYSLIHFDNRDNVRDPEFRDVFQIRLGEGHPVPWPSAEFQSAVEKLYNIEWDVCVKTLQLLASAFGRPEESLYVLAGSESNQTPKATSSINSNLSVFRYFDEQGYATAQKCMVHRDYGTLTLLPRTNVPGLEFYHEQLKQWVPIEKFMQDDEVLLYCGLSLEVVVDGAIKAALHRVSREPKTVRYSQPFEMKPNSNDSLVPIVGAAPSHVITYEMLKTRLDWDKVQTQVARSDGIEPSL